MSTPRLPKTPKKISPQNTPRKGKKGKKKPSFFQQLILTIVIIAAVSVIYSAVANKDKAEKEISLSEVAQMVVAGEVEEIVVEGDKLEITLLERDEEGEEGIQKISKKEREASLLESLSSYGVTSEELATVSIEIQNESGFGYWIGQLLPFLIPLIVLVIIIWFFFGQMKGGGMKAFSFGQTNAKVLDPDKKQAKFKDVAGNEGAKQELEEIVDFLKNPKKFIDIGAKIPKGVLLTGAPGTGKTLLARAVAGEAGVPFFYLSGSEFVEMFVGVGASRVRDLFAQAKKAAPAIIFIDEIDAVGRHRGGGMGSGNDEREQTLNQILVEMDGFEPNQRVIIMAATNRPDVLDRALLRPGRFDRRVILEVPDRKDRLAILKVHVGKKPLAEDVDLAVIAERTPGFSGADLESLMNEAAILAARRNKKEVAQIEFIESIEKVMIGPERKNHLHSDKERRIVAYHEAGHALVGSVLPHSDPVHKISIVARGHAGGYTLKLPLEERKLSGKKHFLDDIAMSLGGYVAEQLTFDDVTTGPSNDLQVATQLARNMVTKWGMSDVVGPVALEGNEGQALFGRGVSQNQHSDHHEKLIDDEVQKIMQNGLAKAREVLTKHSAALTEISEELLKHETLEQDAYDAILTKHGIALKEKKKDVQDEK